MPDYSKCRQLFETYLKSQGKTRTSKLDFTPTKKGKNKRTIVADSDEEEKPKKKSPKQNGDAPKPKRGRKLARDPSPESDNENEEPDSTSQDSIEEKVVKRRNDKRKSSEPTLLVKVKKTKLTPKATPPAKKNHANMATQTSVERPKRSPRQVSFDSPICEIIGDKKPFKASKDNESANSSGDIFEDSFVIEEKKVKPKKRLLANEEVTVKRVIKKKVTTVKPKGKSWKDTPAVLNGQSPKK